MSFGFGFSLPAVVQTPGGPSLLLDFAGTKALDPRVTFTRASAATYFDADGVLQSAASDVARFDHNPTTRESLGLLIEESRVNSIRNNTMQGAVAGTPGTIPTNWTASLAGGLSRKVVGTGTINGISYIDLRVFGTTTNTNLAINLIFEGNVIAAAAGQSWSESVWVSLIAGSTTGISSIYQTITERSSLFADLAYNAGPTFLPTIGSFLRRTYTATLSNASTAFVVPSLWLAHTGIGAVVDITLRIGLPQLELGAFATSVIPTTTTAVTRAADVASVNTLSPWYSASEGTLYSEATFTNTVSFNTVASLDDGGGTNSIRTIQWNNGTDRIYTVTVGGVTQAGLVGTGQVGTAKFAGAYQVNNFNGAKNGVAGITDTSGTVPTVTTLNLGKTGTTFYLNGWLRRVSYFPRRLSNAELQALTR